MSRKNENWKKKTGFSTDFWSLYCGLSKEATRKRLSGYKRPAKNPERRHIKTKTGFSGRFWAAYAGCCYHTILQRLKGKVKTKRLFQKGVNRGGKVHQEWCQKLASEFNIKPSRAATFKSREHYIQCKNTIEDYNSSRLYWVYMEQQWGKAEWKESEIRKNRARERYRRWLAKCKKENRSFLLGKRIRSNIGRRLRSKIKRGLSASGFADFDTKRTIQHLQSKFKRGMTWQNWGKKWEIDHVIALAKFDLKNPEHVRRANHWTNLQPLWKEDNRSKGAKGGGQLQLVMSQ